MLNIKNKDTKTTLTISNFEQISHRILGFLSLTLNR